MVNYKLQCFSETLSLTSCKNNFQRVSDDIVPLLHDSTEGKVRIFSTMKSDWFDYNKNHYLDQMDCELQKHGTDKKKVRKLQCMDEKRTVQLTTVCNIIQVQPKIVKSNLTKHQKPQS